MRVGAWSLNRCSDSNQIEVVRDRRNGRSRTIQLFGIALALALAGGAQSLLAQEADAVAAEEQKEEQDWPWPESLDAVAAAPESHEILLENASVRVVRVYIPAGIREPEHTHRWPSVMIVDQPARIRYYDENKELVFESPLEIERSPGQPNWMGPEGPHSVENVDTRPYYAYRIELKRDGGN